jgi:hypothetical protein
LKKKVAKKKKVVKVGEKPVTKKQSGGKKRGRPSGSKNKNDKNDKNDNKNGNKNKKPKWKMKSSKDMKDVDPNYVPPKSYKVLGYCPRKSCHLCINTSDLVTKFIFVCPKCGKRARTSKLMENNPFSRGPISKREFLGTTNAFV